MSTRQEKIGRVSVWVASLAIGSFLLSGFPISLSRAVYHLKNYDKDRAFEIVFFGSFIAAELLALTCGVAAGETRMGKIGATLACIFLVPIIYVASWFF